jgi:hypothetical protein
MIKALTIFAHGVFSLLCSASNHPQQFISTVAARDAGCGYRIRIGSGAVCPRHISFLTP